MSDKELFGQKFKGERSLFASHGLTLKECVFEGGESPLKESSELDLTEVIFRWKYPLWYCKNVKASDCLWMEGARAGVWYTDNIEVKNTTIMAPKNFRRCKGLTLSDVVFTDAKETLWSCRDVRLDHVSVKGDYFAMNCSDIEVNELMMDGNYSFDGTKNVTVRNSRLVTKDAFWNSENVTVYDSFISGEYLGWNSKNLTLINCCIESLQGMCYIDNLVMKNCRLFNTTLAFEYSNVDAEITTEVDSVLNPTSGTIRAERIGELIIERDRIDPTRTKIICNDIEKESDRLIWPE